MRFRNLSLVALLTISLCGCITVRRTDPARTATEQLLISTAADRAAAALELAGVGNKKVTLVDARFDSYDKLYVISLLEERLLKIGAILEKNPVKADWIVEIRSGALSIDHDSWLLGIPELSIPFFGAAIPIPELAIFKKDNQTGIAKFAWTARGADGKLVANDGPDHGTAHVTHWAFFTVPFTSGDVLPEEVE